MRGGFCWHERDKAVYCRIRRVYHLQIEHPQIDVEIEHRKLCRRSCRALGPHPTAQLDTSTDHECTFPESHGRDFEVGIEDL